MYKQTVDFVRDFLLYLHDHHISFMVNYRRNVIAFLFAGNTMIDFYDGEIAVEKQDGTVEYFGYAIGIEKLVAKSGI